MLKLEIMQKSVKTLYGKGTFFKNLFQNEHGYLVTIPVDLLERFISAETGRPKKLYYYYNIHEFGRKVESL